MHMRSMFTEVRAAAAMATLALLLIPIVGSALGAQDAASVIQQAENDRAAFNATAALGRYEIALATAPTQYDLLWRAAREAVDLGEAAPTPAQRAEFNKKAEGYARRAVAANSTAADGHFMLAVALGRTALTLGARDRVRYAAEIHDEAALAAKIDPRHAGALHVLGVWNAEIMRLSGLTRFAARNFLGGKIFDQASWANATRYMEAAVAVDPSRITHRLDLARIYADNNAKPKARVTCEAALRLPSVEFNDARYKQECERLIIRSR